MFFIFLHMFTYISIHLHDFFPVCFVVSWLFSILRDIIQLSLIFHGFIDSHNLFYEYFNLYQWLLYVLNSISRCLFFIFLVLVFWFSLILHTIPSLNLQNFFNFFIYFHVYLNCFSKIIIHFFILFWTFHGAAIFILSLKSNLTKLS